MLKNSSTQSGQTVLVFVLMVVALLIVFYARGIQTIEVEQTITEHARLNKMAENAYQNVTQNAIWLLEADARRKADRMKNNSTAVDVDSQQDMWNKGPDSPYIEGQIIVRWRIVDAHSYFPVNTLITVADKNVNADSRERFEQFLINLKIEEADKLTASLADWLDPAPIEPNVNQEEGAPQNDPADTNEFEEGAHNGPLLTLSEIQMVPGYTNDILEGNVEESRLSLMSALTVCPITKINPNTAPAWVLTAMHKDISRQTATRISNSAKYSPFEKMEDVERVAGKIEGLDYNSIFLLKSNFFFLEMLSEYGIYTQKKRVLLLRQGTVVTVEKVENIGFFLWDEELITKMNEAVENLIESLDK